MAASGRRSRGRLGLLDLGRERDTGDEAPTAVATTPANDAAWTPAAHSTVRVGMRTSLGFGSACEATTRTQVSVIPTTRVLSRTATPSFRSCRSADADCASGYAGRSRGR